MDPLLERLELEPVTDGDEDLASTTSGKYRVSGLVLRLASSTSSPSRNTMHRKPSHLGSKTSPPNFTGSGIPFTDLASIGRTGGITGRSMPRP